MIVALLLIAAEPSASEIAQRALENNSFSTSNARATVELDVQKDGKTVRSRRIITKIKRKDGEVKSFVEFTAPADVAGTKFLSLEKNSESAEQFIYLPAFKKIKRVVGAQKAGSFMGTDFSYADLDGRDVDDAQWSRQKDETIDGVDCWVIEGQPKKTDEDDQYGRTLIWVHKEHFLPMRIDFFDRDKTTVKKRLLVKKLEKKNERWIAAESVMATLSKSTETRLKLASVDFDTPIPDDEFSQRALER